MSDQPTPTAEQIARYAELRDSGKTPIEATRIVRSEAKDKGGERR